MVVQLTTIAEVQRVGRLNALEYTDAEIASEIADVSLFIHQRYGNPIKRTYFDMIQEFNTYDFTGDDNPVASVTKVVMSGVLTVGGYSTGSIVTGNSAFSFDTTVGNVTILDSFITPYEGKRITVEWIPSSYELMAKYKTAINLIGDTSRSGGETDTPTFVGELKTRLMETKELFKPRKASFSKKPHRDVRQLAGTDVEQDRFVKPLE